MGLALGLTGSEGQGLYLLNHHVHFDSAAHYHPLFSPWYSNWCIPLATFLYLVCGPQYHTSYLPIPITTMCFFFNLTYTCNFIYYFIIKWSSRTLRLAQRTIFGELRYFIAQHNSILLWHPAPTFTAAPETAVCPRLNLRTEAIATPPLSAKAAYLSRFNYAQREWRL